MISIGLKANQAQVQVSWTQGSLFPTDTAVIRLKPKEKKKKKTNKHTKTKTNKLKKADIIYEIRVEAITMKHYKWYRLWNWKDYESHYEDGGKWRQSHRRMWRWRKLGGLDNFMVVVVPATSEEIREYNIKYNCLMNYD